MLTLVAGAASASGSVGFYGCRSFTTAHPRPIVRPRSIVLACADANAYLTGLHWSSWSAASARGIGALNENDCTPNCAAGHFDEFAAIVTLSQPKRCKGATVFTRVSWLSRGKRSAITYGC